MPTFLDDSDEVIRTNVRRAKSQFNKKLRLDSAQNLGELAGHKIMSMQNENTAPESGTKDMKEVEPNPEEDTETTDGL